MTGKQLQDAAVQLARTKGYRCAHFVPAYNAAGKMRTAFAYDSKGFPDLLLLGRKVIAVEVKGSGDSLRPEQREWLGAFISAGVETLVLTPKGWLAGELEAIL